VGVAAVLLSSGCGQAGQPAGDGGSPGPTTASVSTSPADGDVTEVPDSRIDGTRLPAGYPRKAWIAADGVTLTVLGEEGGCEHVRSTLAEQNATAVRVILIRDMTDSHRPCSKDLRAKKLTMRLDQPLAERTVVLEQQTLRP